jgi:hypothetical protein
LLFSKVIVDKAYNLRKAFVENAGHAIIATQATKRTPTMFNASPDHSTQPR